MNDRDAVWGRADLRGSRNVYKTAVGYTLTPPGECDGLINAATATRPAATITITLVTGCSE